MLFFRDLKTNFRKYQTFELHLFDYQIMERSNVKDMRYSMNFSLHAI